MITLKIALIQHANQGNVVANRELIAHEIAEAAQSGANLVCLQELHDERYFCQTEDPDCFDLAEPVPGPGTDFLGRLSAEHQVVIVGSLFERRAAGLYHNTAVVLERNGELAGRYRKMHIPDDPGFYEKFYFTPGDLGFTPIETSVGKLGVLVCWDQWYPEAARLMALAGAEILLYPTAIGWDPNDPLDEQHRQLEAWQTIQRSHAVANGLPVISCNRVGFEPSPQTGSPGIDFWGHSFICGPQGELIAETERDSATLVAEVNMSRSETVRRIWPFLRDRRIDDYAAIEQRFID